MTRPTISDHAIARYQERVEPLSPEDVRAVIAAAVQRSVNAALHRAVEVGTWRIVVGRVTFVMAGPHVVTVLTGRSDCMARTRVHCRRQIADRREVAA